MEERSGVHAGVVKLDDFSGVSQLFRLILDNIPAGIFWKDRNLEYLGCNMTFAIAAGVGSTENIKGKTDYDMPWAHEEADWYREIDARVMANDRPEYHIMETQLQADGHRAWVDTNKIPLHDSEGRVIGILGTFEDITERKLTQEALQQAHDELDLRVKERTADLQEANALLKQEINERKQVEATEREQRTLAEALRDTAAVINSTLEPDQVLDRILSEIGRVVPHSMANIIMVQGETATIVRRRDPGRNGVPAKELSRSFPLDSRPSLQRMRETQKPLIIENTRTSPLWVTRPGESRVRSYLGTPILIENAVIGFINLYGSTTGFFKGSDGERLRAFADQAAIAIQNALLYERAQATAALEERQRLARDLHDAVSQTLWTVSLLADVLPTLWAHDREEGRSALVRLRQLTQGALVEMRALLIELRPAALTGAKVEDLVRHLIDAAMSRKRIRISLTVEGSCSLPADVQVVVYRIAQEALNNVTRHSQATRAWVRLSGGPERVGLRIRDNGRGFDPNAHSTDHLGLDIMRERAEAIRAALKVESAIGAGTAVTLRWFARGQHGARRAPGQR
jgi:PAS domain S-box-containing protein